METANFIIQMNYTLKEKFISRGTKIIDPEKVKAHGGDKLCVLSRDSFLDRILVFRKNFDLKIRYRLTKNCL